MLPYSSIHQLAAEGTTGGEGNRRRRHNFPTTINDLPEDLISETLSNLQVRDIFRARCVNRSWLKLTKETKFINKNAFIAPSSLFLMLSKESIQFYSSNSFDKDGQGINETKEIKLNHQIYTSYSHFQLIGCLKGLVCLIDTDLSNVILWNTVLRQVKVMSSLNEGEDNQMSVYGIGNVLDALRFVCICKDSRSKTLVKIRTVSSDSSWNSIKEFPLDVDPHFDLAGSGKHVNNSVNWIMGTTQLIPSTELDERYVKKLVVPKFGDGWFSKTISVWKDYLRILCHDVENNDVWIMRSEENWIQILRIPHMNVLGSPYIKNIFYILKDGKVLLEVVKDFNWEIIVFDSINDKVIESNIEKKVGAKMWELYWESLIFP